MIEMAKKDLNELIEKREKYENRIKIFFYQRWRWW